MTELTFAVTTATINESIGAHTKETRNPAIGRTFFFDQQALQRSTTVERSSGQLHRVLTTLLRTEFRIIDCINTSRNFPCQGSCPTWKWLLIRHGSFSCPGKACQLF